MLLCVRERTSGDSPSHASLQRQFSHGHGQKKFDDAGSGSGTRVSHFLPTSRRIVQFSNEKVILIIISIFLFFLFISVVIIFGLLYFFRLLDLMLV